MTRFRVTAAAAAATCVILGTLAATGPATPVSASDIPAELAASSLLPQSVVTMAKLEGETPAMPLPSLDDPFPNERDDDDFEAPRATSLAALVREHSGRTPEGREGECLAGAIYFESKGEPLDGQLAVAKTVLNRARSGRFPTSVCGVVFQPSQFSFVRGGGFPPIARGGQQWKTATAIAHIAQNDLWDSSVDNALFFHARHVSPGWRMRRLASVGNHVFYR